MPTASPCPALHGWGAVWAGLLPALGASRLGLWAGLLPALGASRLGAVWAGLRPALGCMAGAVRWTVCWAAIRARKVSHRRFYAHCPGRSGPDARTSTALDSRTVGNVRALGVPGALLPVVLGACAVGSLGALGVLGAPLPGRAGLGSDDPALRLRTRWHATRGPVRPWMQPLRGLLYHA
ncbi:MAG: hypothetical protein LLF96_06800 [Eubacteriales bacterium]|nr:hypothetical protein [Eubacteriales bacterium]